MTAGIYNISIEQGATFQSVATSLPAPTGYTPSANAKLIGQGPVATRPATSTNLGDLWYDVASDPPWSRWNGASWDNVTPNDLTGWSARMKLRKQYSDSSAVLSMTSPTASGTGIDMGGTAGTVTINISAVDTAALDSTYTGTIQGVYDLELFDGSSPAKVIRLLKGTWTLDFEATR